MFDLKKLVRPNILRLKPYSSARSEYTGNASVFLDANENPYGSVLGKPYNRYPDPLQKKVKEKLSRLKNINPENIFIGNGSDEPIDLLFRAFCEPKKNNAVVVAPTYGMYKVAADINDVPVKEVPLNEDFTLDPERITEGCDKNTRLVFLCSPNNPTGNAFDRESILKIVSSVECLVLVDEAYIDFTPENTLLPEVNRHPNLVVLQTLSKAWGMAALRVGFAFASSEIIDILNKIKYPYNINAATQEYALEALENQDRMYKMVDKILGQKKFLEKALKDMPLVRKIYPSDANFMLIKVDNPVELYNYLVKEGVIVRDRSKVLLCEGGLRITVGTEEENESLIRTMNKFKER